MPPARARVLFLGTGNAFNTDGRASPALWIEPAAAPPFLVDVGPTALAAMGRSRVDPDALDRVFITHLHGDHIAGWPFLLLHAKYLARRQRPLQVFGPAGVRQRLETLAAACYEEVAAAALTTFAVDCREIPVSRHSGLDAGAGIRFDVVPLDHHATSVGYRFHVGGIAIGVSGDTRWCEGLEDLAAGCDLLVLECSTLEKPDFAHVSLAEIRAGREQLRARRLALVHLTNDITRALSGRPMPDVVAAEDGMILDV